jgi:hypothetical protein
MTGERPSFLSERSESRLTLKLPDLTLDSRPSCRSRDAPMVGGGYRYYPGSVSCLLLTGP